jgi:hypothetical protein
MRVVILGVCVVLAGCVSTIDPVPMGNGVYMISTRARGGLSTDAQLTSKTVAAANAFCGRSGKSAIVQTASSSGVQGFTPQDSQVLFKCE